MENIQQEIKIFEPFQTLIPPLDEETFKILENDILERGILNPLIVWNGYLVDGHHRLKIAQKYNIPFKTKELENFKTESEVMMWMIKNQFTRRNLSLFEKGVLALKNWELLESVTDPEDMPNKDKYCKATFNISGDTVSRVKVLLNSNNEKLINAVKNGEKTLYEAWVKLKKFDKVKHRSKRSYEESKGGFYVNENCFEYMQGMTNRGKANCIITEPVSPTDEDIIKRFEDENYRKGYCSSVFNKTCKMLDDFIAKDADLFFIIDPDYLALFYNTIREYFKIRQILIWDYRNNAVDKQNYDRMKCIKSYNIVIMAYKGKPKEIDIRMHDIIKVPKKKSRKGLPVELLEELVSFIERDNTVLFDPFAGYGAIILAALRKRLLGIGCEFNTEVYNTGCEYIKAEFDETAGT